MKFGEFIHQLLGGRDYKDIDGVPYVKEGFGSWERFDAHLKREHPELWDKMIESERKPKQK
jgi:hypothetical protein